jgi:hypothetical protein
MTSTKDNLNNRIIPPDGGHDQRLRLLKSLLDLITLLLQTQKALCISAITSVGKSYVSHQKLTIKVSKLLEINIT